jgi:hypothetical protein
MDAQPALDELTTLSQQVVEAVLTSSGGRVDATTVADEERAQALARAGQELLAAADGVRPAGAVERVEVALDAGSVFCVRAGERTIVATTIAEPTPGLVLYDLRTALRRSAQAPRRTRRARSEPGQAGGDA